MGSPYFFGSEKRAIKENLFDPAVRIASDPILKGGNQYVRSLLGVAGFYEYRDNERNGGRFINQKTGKEQLKLTRVNISSPNVERFASPLLFKVLDNRIYILPLDCSPIQDKSFTFSDEYGYSTAISTPKTIIDLADILKEFATHFNTMRIAESKKLRVLEKNDRGGRGLPKHVVPYLTCLEEVELKKL